MEGSLARLTGCFAPNYEFHNWSNVVRVLPTCYCSASCSTGASNCAICSKHSTSLPPAPPRPASILACPPAPLQVCVRRDHLLYPHMERMSTRYARYAGVYYQDDLARGGSTTAGTASARRQTAR